MSDDKKQLLNKWYTRIRFAQTGHYQEANRHKRNNVVLGVPVVALTAIVGTGVFASLAEDNPSITLRIVLGLTSLLAASLASLHTFLNYSEQSARHLSAATKLSSLKKEIEENLVLLPPDAQELADFIKQVRTQWNMIVQEAPILSEATFQRNFPKAGTEKLFVQYDTENETQPESPSS